MTFPWPLMRSAADLVCVICLLLPCAASAAVDQPRSHVEDQAGVLDPAAASTLSAMLQDLEHKTGAQFVILTVPSTRGVPIEQFALERAERWGLGHRGKDDGLLFVIAVEDRKYRFETGYGLEQILPDSLLGGIGRKYLVPRFRQGDYAGGITGAASAIARIIAEKEGTAIEDAPQAESTERSRGFPIGPFLFFVLACIVLIFLARSHSRRSRGGGDGVLVGSTLGGMPRRGPGGFDSFGGGGFGSFGGGGGFGGGGASGGW